MTKLSSGTEPRSAERNDIRIPVTVVTGFLGSGKTTLMNRALRDPLMAKTAVVVNEFGEISIDHALLSASNDNIIVLENGCLCCTVFGDLVKTLNKLYHARESGEVEFDRVVVETSGLVDLPPVLQAFLSEPTLEGLFRVAGVISTVDAVNGPNTLSTHTVSVSQVALSDHVLITKLDLIPASDRTRVLETLTQRLRRLNVSGSIFAADAPGVDPIQMIRQSRPDPARGGEHVIEWLNGVTDYSNTSFAQVQKQAAHSHDPTIASFSLVRDTPVSRDALSLLLSSLEHHLGGGLLRVKGLVNVAEEPEQPAVIQGAQHLLHNLTWLAKWPDADRRTRIVFITQGIEPADLEEMVGLLERVATRTAAARQRACSSALSTDD